MSRICLLAQAKNEDHYIQEWIDYHQKLNFDDIFIIQDNWSANIRNDANVHLIDGYLTQNIGHDKKQLIYYSDFINKHNKDYDWIVIFDIDEFLFLKEFNDIHNFLETKTECGSIGFHWRMFGDNNITKLNENYKVISRFTRSCKECSVEFKSAYNMNRLRILLGQEILDSTALVLCHEFRDLTLNGIRLRDQQFGVDGITKIVSNYDTANKDERIKSKDIAYLAHYRKTYPEFIERYRNTKSSFWTKFIDSMDNDMTKVYQKMNPPYFNEVENKDLLNLIKDDNV